MALRNLLLRAAVLLGAGGGLAVVLALRATPPAAVAAEPVAPQRAPDPPVTEPSPAQAKPVTVKGIIANFRELENPVWKDAANPKNRGYSFREAVPTIRPEFRRLFPHAPKELCIAALGTEKAKVPKPILVRVGGGRATPVTMVVPPGTQLSFKNTDPFAHRLHGVEIATFQAAATMKGATREWTVAAPGAYEVRDELAPSLRFWVIGEPNVAASVYPNLKGEFALSLPAGDYTIQVYFAGKKVGDAKPVKVEATDLDLTKEPIKVAPDPKPAAKDAEKK
ncbi:MAG: hypothetical protein IT376_06915 [Polyangiaceae bacterium]|nr:hypothetical protein [Polyangiaceae bacterium]